MASACGLEASILMVGKLRVAIALVFGLLARVVGIRGIFYKVIGKCAAAIDDLTGTLPPYDRFVVFAPVRCQEVVNEVRDQTGLRCAIVDVNDKSAVTGTDAGGLNVLASSEGVNEEKLLQALKHNPAGNADQKTPIVLVRGLS